MHLFEREVKYLKGVGEKRAALFGRLGIITVGDLLAHYPRGYEDFSSPVPIHLTEIGGTCCIRAVVLEQARPAPVRRGLTLYRVLTADDTGECEITFFNNRYAAEALQPGEPYLFYGRVEGGLLRRRMASPEFEKAEGAPAFRALYPAAEGLPSRVIAAAVGQALALLAAAPGEPVADSLPDALRARYGLCHLRYAIRGIHRPDSHEALETARRRLVFGELLALQLGMLSMKSRSRGLTGAVCEQSDLAPFLKALPFAPTGAQMRAMREAAADMAKPHPMSRLLEGDVGSGKTAVAAALCFLAGKNGFQSALMAPTEILARQHFTTLSALLAPCGLRVCLLTGSLPADEKEQARRLLASHGADVAVGTHALVQEGVAFASLGLVVTDEQHRFGVAQRAALAGKGHSPHTLIMSATPIPRTLSLLLYGDLDVSVLDELPAGRQPVKTYVVDSSKRKRVYAFLKRHFAQGLQAYIVCPLVEEGDGGLASVETYADGIARNDFAPYRVGVLHGRMKPSEKERVMEDFAAGKTQLLIATTVVEVGVDVPRAAVMVVENAERFGLSQLHQLRGRVGRGSAQSHCILISDAENETAKKRLSVMTQTNDGFKIAETDLALRGPGDFFGHRQHGLPALKIADLVQDMGTLRETRQAAAQLLKDDPALAKPENQGLRAACRALFSGDVVFN